MATNEELYKMRLIVEGEAKARELEVQIANTEVRLKSLGDAFAAGQMSAAQFAQRLKAPSEALIDFKAKLQQTEKELGKLGAGGGRNGGRALMEVSRAAEDAQYGLNGVLNNIPGLVMALGGSAGLVGVISLVTVGAYQLYKNWDNLAGLFGAGHVKTAAEEMEELRKKTSLTADEAERLARADALQGKVKDLRGAKTKEQKKTEEAVTEAITEAGSKNVAAGLLKVDQGAVDGQGTVPAALEEEKKAREALKKLETRGVWVNGAKGEGFYRDATEEELNPLRAKLTDAGIKTAKARKDTAEEMAATGALPQFFPENLNKLIGQVEKDPAAFAGGDLKKGEELLASLKQATPEYRKKKEQIDKEADEAWEATQESIEGIKQWSKDYKAKVKQATKDKSFLGKDDKDLTGAQIEAKRLHEKSEAEIAEAMRTKSFVGKQDSELTPAQKEAKTRSDKLDAEREKRSNKASAMVKDQLGEDPFLDSSLQLSMLGGEGKTSLQKRLTEYLKSMNADLSDADAAEIAKDQVNASGKRLNSELLQGDSQHRASEIVGVREMANKIQTSFTNDNIPKNQLDVLKNILDQLKKNPQAAIPVAVYQ